MCCAGVEGASSDAQAARSREEGVGGGRGLLEGSFGQSLWIRCASPSLAGHVRSFGTCEGSVRQVWESRSPLKVPLPSAQAAEDGGWCSLLDILHSTAGTEGWADALEGTGKERLSNMRPQETRWPISNRARIHSVFWHSRLQERERSCTHNHSLTRPTAFVHVQVSGARYYYTKV